VRGSVGSDLRYNAGIEKIAAWLEKVGGGRTGFTVALTSVRPAEGVTHLVIDLIHHFSIDRGKKVVAVDLAGMGSLIKGLGANEEILLGERSNLHPAGPGNSYVLRETGLPARLDSESVNACLKSVTAEADIVLIDAPHILEEGFVALAGSVDVVIVVLDMAITSRHEAASAMDRMKKAAPGRIGVVINRGRSS
jgi:cellulose biosynthesis protein BcsQ